MNLGNIPIGGEAEPMKGYGRINATVEIDDDYVDNYDPAQGYEVINHDLPL